MQGKVREKVMVQGTVFRFTGVEESGEDGDVCILANLEDLQGCSN